MAKKLLQDMVKIRSVNYDMKVALKKDIPQQSKILIKNPIQNITNKKRGNSARYALWLVAVTSIAVFAFALSHLFLKATVNVDPKIEDVVLNDNMFATKDANTSNLPFDLVVISGEETKTVQATEEKDISISSKGKVLIYNNFGSSSQRLDIDTRLEGSNGKIYKTKKAIVVPGKVGDIPGKIEVEVYASKAGAEYDSAPLDFTIVGFKGTAKYTKFYGRGVGDITGGFKGKSLVVSDAVLKNTIAELKESLQMKLSQKAIAPGFVLFKNAAFLNIDEQNVPFNTTGDKNVPITIKGTLYGFLFNEDKLTSNIVKNKIEEYDGSTVYMSNIEDLNFSLSNKENISIKDLQNINFNLSGTAKIIWKLDENKLITDLLGKSKGDFNQVLLNYPNIVSAQLIISPFWKTSIPDKSKDIKVIVNYPK